MQVADQQSPNAMWEKTRLFPYFVRSVRVEKRPVGKVFKEKDGEFRAEVEESYILQLADAKTGKERSIVIDPRHGQNREHLKLAQEVLEGRAGGLTPIRMQFEKTSALDPDGNPVTGSEIERVAEMESPVPTRAEATVVVDGKQIGQWSHELDAAVDRTVSFEIAHNFAGYMQGLSEDQQGVEWKEIETLARKKLMDSLRSEIADEEQLKNEVERFMPTRESFLAGQHADRSGTNAALTVWDPVRNQAPENHAERAAYFTQQSLVERFQVSMLNVPRTDAHGNMVACNVTHAVEGDLLQEKHLPAGRPKRNLEVDEMVANEKSRAIATHMFAGYMKTLGAKVMDPELAAELKEKHRMHEDITRALEEAAVPTSQRPKLYFAVANIRAKAYRLDAAQKTELEARKVLKFPDAEQKKEETDVAKKLQGLTDGAMKYGAMAHQAGEQTESISFGL